ncbi:leukotriene B4 receptor 1-like [Antennarius striatus]|uniref:leukotriene B4 receptor 1-like n=1 Tax=Antennarius striatus TaxID=241820 RepID=UPI0035B1F405
MASNNTATTFQQPSPVGDTSVKVRIAILTLVFMVGFPGNLFVVWSILCRVKKRSVTCLLVLNLALADASVLLCAPIFLRYIAYNHDWELGSAGCRLIPYLSSVNMYVSIYLICLMSMDRWLAVTRPFLYQRMRTKRSLLFLLLGVWTMAFLLSVPLTFYRRIQYIMLPNNSTLRLCKAYHWGRTGHRVFQCLLETIMGCLVPFFLINTCYAAIICRLRSAKFQRKAKGSRLILLIICAFSAFWLPYHITNIIEVVGLLQENKSVINAAQTARPYVTGLAFFSSAINPILYVFAGSSHIRQAGLSFMGKLFEGTNHENKTTSIFTRSAQTSSSSTNKRFALFTLSLKLVNPFKSNSKQRSTSTVESEVNKPQVNNVTCNEQLER